MPHDRRGPGRPTAYAANYAAIARNLRKMRLPVAAIAAALGVSERTTWRWRKQHKQFRRSIAAKCGSEIRNIVRARDAR